MYPRMTNAAARLANTLNGVINQAMPQVEIATVADASNHLNLGYVVATVGKGHIQVYGVPPGTVVPGMRLYVRPRTLNTYLFQSFAPFGELGYTSGSLLVKDSLGALAGAKTTGITLPTSTSTGYYWSLFFYTPQLPPTTMCLFDFRNGPGVRCTYGVDGTLKFAQYGVGYNQVLTAGILAPHQLWYLTLQMTTGCLTNGYSSTTTGTVSWPTTSGTFYATWLNSSDGTLPCQPGTWISKMSFGTAPSFPTTDVPTNDGMIPNGRATLGAGVRTQLCYLCDGDLTDAGLLNLTATLGAATLSNIGPY